MSETVFQQYEHRYRQMGELLLGTVRATSERTWSWPSGERACMYYCDPSGIGGVLAVLETSPDGGANGKQFVFGKDDIQSVVDLTLSSEQVKRGVDWSMLFELHRLEFMYDPERQLTEDERQLFWDSLQAPLAGYET